MKSLIFYTGLILLLEYGLGYGLAKKLLPKTLTKHVLIMSPWVLNILIILTMVITSSLGIPGKWAAYSLMIILVTLTILEIKNLKMGRTELLLGFTVLASVIFNNSPLVLRDRFLTTISLGNNDVIAYATNSDYLVSSSIRDSFRQDVVLTIANLLQDGYRWGTPLLQTFFLSITQTPAWKITYLMQTILFATMLPLGYVLYLLWYDNKEKLGWIIPILIGWNANLLYMLYHNFYGQVVFWGIELTSVILLTMYFKTRENKLEWLIGGCLAAMYMAYHEGALFILLPLILTAFLARNLLGLLRMAGITLIFAGISVVNAIVFDFGQAFRGNPNQAIGWQVFRSKSPMSNPFEMLGLSSVHTAPPLPMTLAWTLSLICVWIILVGVIKSKRVAYLSCMASVFALLFYWTSWGKNGNWFVFNRAFTYVLPILLIIFAGGIAQINNKIIRVGLMLTAIVLMTLQSMRINWKFVNSHLSVSPGYRSLEEVKKMKIDEPIYTLGMINPYMGIWDEIWTGYFLFENIENISLPKQKIADQNLILQEKSTPWVRYPSYLVSETIWQNEAYKLGRVCLSDECLVSNNDKLDEIVFGKSEFEDSLIGSGWSNPELDGRWVEGKRAELKLITVKNKRSNKLEIEVKAVVSGIELETMVDGKSVGKTLVGTEWQKNVFDIDIADGIHTITLSTNREISPNQLDNGSDLRKLSVRFKSIEFKGI